MKEKQKQHRKINWFKSYANLALGVWGLATYLAVLVAIAWVACAITGGNPQAIALVAVSSASLVNWALFAAIERRTRN